MLQSLTDFCITFHCFLHTLSTTEPLYGYLEPQNACDMRVARHMNHSCSPSYTPITEALSESLKPSCACFLRQIRSLCSLVVTIAGQTLARHSKTVKALSLLSDTRLMLWVTRLLPQTICSLCSPPAIDFLLSSTNTSQNLEIFQTYGSSSPIPTTIKARILTLL